MPAAPLTFLSRHTHARAAWGAQALSAGFGTPPGTVARHFGHFRCSECSCSAEKTFSSSSLGREIRNTGVGGIHGAKGSSPQRKSAWGLAEPGEVCVVSPGAAVAVGKLWRPKSARGIFLLKTRGEKADNQQAKTFCHPKLLFFNLLACTRSRIDPLGFKSGEARAGDARAQSAGLSPTCALRQGRAGAWAESRFCGPAGPGTARRPAQSRRLREGGSPGRAGPTRRLPGQVLTESWPRRQLAVRVESAVWRKKCG